MEPRYERNIPALTEAECLALRNKRVLVVGCGGLCLCGGCLAGHDGTVERGRVGGRDIRGTAHG